MAGRKYIFKNTKPLGTDQRPFTHYGTNEGNNYPDVKDIEEYLTQYYPEPYYKWVEVPYLRLEKTTVDSFKIDISARELKDNKTIFIKLIDEETHDIPQYFYCKEIRGTSDENYEVTDYQGICVMDYWATFGCKMNFYMKDSTNVEQFLFLRKMCNRFYKNNSNDSHFTLDYLTMPYLMQTGNYVYRLIRDEREDELPLDQWLFINSTFNNINDFVSVGNLGKKSGYPSSYLQTYDKEQFVSEKYIIEETLNIDKIQNISLTFLRENSFDDDFFNSWGKYRYFVFKIGNNTLPATEGNASTSQEEFNHKAKAGLTLEKINEIKNTEEGQKDITTFINGETLCIIPFPKGEKENNYLTLLNSYNKGLILGNGSVLGMPINDIPPSVLALSLRTYNDEVLANQTIGDKLSFRDIKLINSPYGSETIRYNCPTSLTSLRISSAITPYILGPFTYGNNVVGGGSNSGGSGIPDPGGYDGDYILPETLEPGYYLAPGQGTSSDLVAVHNGGGGSRRAIHDPKTGEDGRFTDIIGDDISGGYYIYDPAPYITGSCAYLKFKENPDPEYDGKTSVKENGEFIVKRKDIIVVPDDQWEGYDFSSEHYYQKESEGATSIYHPETDESYEFLPCILHDFSNIPVTLVKKYSNERILGQSQGFQSFIDMLKSTPGEDKLNTIENEPLLYSPAFGQGIYYIDGLHKIILTADMIDFDKLINKENGKVNLNVALTNNTNFKLDIEDIQNKLYPFTRSATQLISNDPIVFPFTTESYNNGLETNVATQETSKNAKDIDNKGARINLPFQQIGAVLGDIGGGIAAGASIGGGIGAGIGAVAGAITGGIEAGLMGVGLRNEIARVNEQWDNQGRGTLSNMYNAPTSLNPSGFASGSLLYSPNKPAKNDSYELFKTFTITPLARGEVGNDISMNGYFFKSECEYRDYENRRNFNIVNCNFDQKAHYVSKYLREKMISSTMLFSQQDYIDGFSMKCKSGIRLFKIDFNLTNVDEMIETNGELNYIKRS